MAVFVSAFVIVHMLVNNALLPETGEFYKIPSVYEYTQYSFSYMLYAAAYYVVAMLITLAVFPYVRIAASFRPSGRLIFKESRR